MHSHNHFFDEKMNANIKHGISLFRHQLMLLMSVIDVDPHTKNFKDQTSRLAFYGLNSIEWVSDMLFWVSLKAFEMYTFHWKHFSIYVLFILNLLLRKRNECQTRFSIIGGRSNTNNNNIRWRRGLQYLSYVWSFAWYVSFKYFVLFKKPSKSTSSWNPTW